MFLPTILRFSGWEKVPEPKRADVCKFQVEGTANCLGEVGTLNSQKLFIHRKSWSVRLLINVLRTRVTHADKWDMPTVEKAGVELLAGENDALTPFLQEA